MIETKWMKADIDQIIVDTTRETMKLILTDIAHLKAANMSIDKIEQFIKSSERVYRETNLGKELR